MITTIIAIIVISVPLLIMSVYLASLGRDTDKIIKKYSGEPSEYVKGVRISFQSLEMETNKSKLKAVDNKPGNSYVDCDMMLTSYRLIVIVKTKMFKKTRLVIPAIITGLHSEVRPAGHSKIVKCMDIREKGADLEIDFMNSRHKNLITITMQDIDNELKNKINKVLQ